MGHADTWLIACPQHESKEYAFDLWLDAVRQFPCEILVVDNSDSLDFYNRWKHQVAMLHLDLDEPPNRRIALSMEHIRKYFLASEHSHWWNIESDVIVSPFLYEFLKPHTRYDWTNLPYRKNGEILERSFGCSLFSKSFMEKVDFSRAPADQTTDGWLYAQFPNVKVIHSALMPIHLKGRNVCHL